jgi:hypothetical protein
VPYGFEVPWPRQLVREGLEVGDETPTEIAPIVGAVSWQMSEPLQHVLPQDDGQLRHHYVFRRSSGPGDGEVDGQPATRVLLGLVLVDVGDL